MKDAEDEAFDELAKRQGDWGGGYQAKRRMAADKINFDFDEEYKKSSAVLAKYRIEEDDDTQGYITANPDALTVAYQSGYYDGKKAALAGREQNFCPRCGKRTNDIHTCTPPQGNT